VALEDKYNLFQRSASQGSLVLFSPVTGVISQAYNAEKKHFAVDVVAEKDAPVKAVANGTVIFSEWTADTGFVLIMEHEEGLLSVYKHNSSLNKEQGDIVRAGEVIASVGNTGEFTTGPHLHFELWSNGNPVNPSDYIDFN
jgi:murein DD-endopeptidase MepM/ murein hydrolase activator NlpD